MPSQQDQKALLSTQGFALLGQGLIGVFFPFFVQRVYGFSDAQIIFWFACLQLGMALLVYPLNYWGVRLFGIRRVVQIGILCQMIFYALLGVGLATFWSFWLLNVAFVLFITAFWPGFNYLSALATQNGDRGRYMGYLQMVGVGVNLVAPVLTGFLLEWGQEQWVLWLSVVSFSVSLVLVRLIPQTGASVSDFRVFFQGFKRQFFNQRAFPAFLADSVITNTMWVLWPLYFKAVVGKFSVMGLITASMAIFEIGASYFIGKISDKKSARWLLQSGAWARCIDLGLRAVYFKFNQLGVVIGIQALGSVLGPWFQIGVASRIVEYGEELETNLLDYLLGRELFLGIFRVLWFLPISVLVYYTDTLYLALAFIIAGLLALGFKRL